MNGDQYQHAIDEATDRVFQQGIENASQADLMFFGFGYLAKVIEKSRPAPLISRGKIMALGATIGAGFLEAAQRFVLPML